MFFRLENVLQFHMLTAFIRECRISVLAQLYGKELARACSRTECRNSQELRIFLDVGVKGSKQFCARMKRIIRNKSINTNHKYLQLRSQLVWAVVNWERPNSFHVSSSGFGNSGMAGKCKS